MKKVIMLFVVVFYFSVSIAQNFKVPGIIPPSPGTQQFENYYSKYFCNQVSPTGTENLSIELYSVEMKGITLPINISYNTGGIRYKQLDGDVGVGWVLSPAARVSRTIIGFPDEAMKRVPTLFNDLEKMTSHIQVDKYLTGFAANDMGNTSYGSSAFRDQGCDIFTFATLNETGHFVFPNTANISEVEILEKTNFKITPFVSKGLITKFEIIDSYGIVYVYGGETNECAHEHPYRNDISQGITGWALKQIITPQKDTITFNYVKYSDKALTKPETKSLSATDAYAYRSDVHSDAFPYSLSTSLELNVSCPNYDTFLLSGIEANGLLISFSRTLNPSILNAVERIIVTDKNADSIIKKIDFSYTGIHENPHFFLDRIDMDGQKYLMTYYKTSDVNIGEYDYGKYTSNLWGYYLYLHDSKDKVNRPIIFD